MRMKKKGYAKGGKVQKKAGGGDLLGSLSPAYGIATGEGAFGKLPLGVLGAAANFARNQDKKSKKVSAASLREQAKQEAMDKATGMKKGGSVKKKMGGGSMKKKGYAKGGMVCRGMGAATRGGKFSVK